MILGRLAPGHVLAAVAALALVLVMATTWYGSHDADLAHEAISGTNIGGAEAGEAARAVKADADRIIARDEKNPWQERATIDRVLLILLLLSVLMPLVAAAYRTAGRRPTPPWTPTMLAALVAVAAALLLAYRMVNEPGNHTQTTVKIGAQIALGLLALIGLGSAWAFRGEADWAERREDAPSRGGAGRGVGPGDGGGPVDGDEPGASPRPS